jgi:hypothetical protein
VAFTSVRRHGIITAAVLASALAAGCGRFRTSEELRLSLREPVSDSTWMRYPCQLLVVDEFGWRADSLEGLRYHVHGSLRSRPMRHRQDRRYESRNRHRVLELRLLVTAPPIYALGTNLQQLRHAECSIAERLAYVVTGRAGFEYHTRVLWPDIGDGQSLLAVASGRTLEDVQVLRGVLFTMRFPGTAASR